MESVSIARLRRMVQQSRKVRRLSAGTDPIRLASTGAGRVHITAVWRSGCDPSFE